jgi:Family of unknown function (DUF5362)
MSSPYEPPPAAQSYPSQPYQPGIHVMQPLHEVRGWLKLIAWFNIILGVIYGITIVGLIIAWLPIWIGICLKKAGESLTFGFPNDNTQMLTASTNLATAIRIIGVLVIINIGIMALYVAILLFAVVLGIAGAAAGR